MSHRDETAGRNVRATPSEGSVDPTMSARRDLKKALPRRFYRAVETGAVGGGFAILLDGKPVRTPAGVHLILPVQALAAALAEEWQAQDERVDPEAMPMTRLANSAIDGVARTVAATVDEVAKFAENDLVCYRATEPIALVQAQAAAWDPILFAVRRHLGARFLCTEGVMYVVQPEAARALVRQAVEAVTSGPGGAFRLASLAVMTNLTGSVLIALAIAQGWISLADGWEAAHVDEDYQIRQWGSDAEAESRRERRRHEMEAAARTFQMVPF